MSVEYKQKTDLPDLYNILGLTIDVCKDPNCDEIIHKAYVKKAKVCHPDKYPGRTDVAEVFELITSAYDILKNENKRTAYNHKLSLNKQSSNDFLKLKKSATDHMQSIGEYKEPTVEQKISFKEQMAALDVKHGFDSGKMDPIPQQDAKKKLNNLMTTRSGQDRDLMPERLFDDGRFDIKKFNAAFDQVHKRDDNAMVAHNGVPAAWNDLGTVANYCAFDNLDNLYVNDGNRFDTSRQTFGGVDFGAPMQKITKDDVNKLRGADYVDGHNVLDENYYKEMKSKLRGREATTNEFEEMKYGDFKRDDTAGYGIFDQLGYKFDDRLALDVEEDDIAKRFEKLMAERQKDILPNGTQQVPQKKARASRSGR
ncbi:J domain-containing protein [Tupanvirus soda lake]|uniref:J domain-containing protein n=2 Tax=Tupanvirus TaxID=2094720 RepID=A0A6N1NV89_9VIRU|nr:J domain-containing protein [Tupanvirus soda lake]QKU35386.1 J domain-containing protein [Tupanvirus soda lake]